jgi:hypothetical protein
VKQADIDRLTKFAEGFRRQRPNSPIVLGVPHDDGRFVEYVHLTIDDVEELLSLAKARRPMIVNINEHRFDRPDDEVRRLYAGLR